MPRKSLYVPILVFAIILGWIACSDTIISYLDKGMSLGSVNIIRSLNDLVVFGVIVFLLYRIIIQQRNKLIDSEKQYRSLFESNPNPMWVYHKHTWAFIAVNDAAIYKYGYSRQEFMKMTIRDIRPANEIEPLEKAIEQQRPGITEMGIWHHIKKSGEYSR